MPRSMLAVLLVMLLTACGGGSTTQEASVPEGKIESVASPSARPDAPEPTIAGQPTETGRVSPTAPIEATEPSLSQPFDSQIVFVNAGLRDPLDGHEQIILVDADGSNPRNLTSHTGNHISPTWSPDGGQIAFIGDREGFQELYVMDADGSNVQRITNNTWNEETPVWAPDGRQIAFDCYPDRTYGGRADSQICVIDADGANLRNLSENTIHGFGPGWSPDGGKLAFVGMEAGEGFEQIFVMDADGSNLRSVASASAVNNFTPAWSPDGQHITFVAPSGNEITNIAIVKADGTDLHEVSAGGYSWHPTWSPDGQHIAFVTGHDSSAEVHVVDADGSNLRPIASTASASYAPVWRPAYLLEANEAVPTPISTPGPTLETPTLEEIYAAASVSLSQTGLLYHATVEIVSDAGLYSYEGKFEHWVDADRNVARTEATADRFEGTTSIVVNGENHVLESYGEVSVRPAQACYGASAAVSVVLGCVGFTEESTTTVEHGDYAGRPAIILLTIGTSRGSDEHATFTRHIYLDASTYLPLAGITTGSLNYGAVVPMEVQLIYQHEFIADDEVPAEFFDPASLKP